MPAARSSSRPLGVVYTPEPLAHAMVANLLAPLVDNATVDALLDLRICDPAAGEGVFLRAVVAQLGDHLAQSSASPDARAQIVQRCIVGADTDAAALAVADRALADHAQLAPGTASRARLFCADALSFDWRASLPDVFAPDRGGFDALVANPPYIRQESLANKDALRAFEAYDGVADYYVYFIELAHRLLRPGGRYSIIVPSKWMTAEYGRPLRSFLAASSSVDTIVDLSAQSTFADADAFPCVITGTIGAPASRPVYAARAPRDVSIESALALVPNLHVEKSVAGSRTAGAANLHVGDRAAGAANLHVEKSVAGIRTDSAPNLHVEKSAAGIRTGSARNLHVEKSVAGARTAGTDAVFGGTTHDHAGTANLHVEKSVAGIRTDSAPNLHVEKSAAGVRTDSAPNLHVEKSVAGVPTDRASNLHVEKSVAGVPTDSAPNLHVEKSAAGSGTAGAETAVASTAHDRALWTAAPWHITAPDERALLARIEGAFPTLGEIIGMRWSRGVVTGLNEAFVIDAATRERMLQTDASARAWIRPFVKGRDVRAYRVAPTERWILLVDRGTKLAEVPRSITDHLTAYRAQLEPRPPDHQGAWPGRKPGAYAWYELQDPVVPLAKSRAPRLLYQDIQTAPLCALDLAGELVPDTTVWILPSADLVLLAILNSPVYRWISQRRFPPALNGAVRPKLQYMQRLPIPPVSDDLRRAISGLVERRLAQSSPDLDRSLASLVADAYELGARERALVGV